MEFSFNVNHVLPNELTVLDSKYLARISREPGRTSRYEGVSRGRTHYKSAKDPDAKPPPQTIPFVAAHLLTRYLRQ